MNERRMKKIPFVTVGVVLMVGLLAALLCSPSEGKSRSRRNGGLGGILSGDQVESILRGAKAVQKTWEDLTPEQEYYIGRAVAAQVFQTYRPLDLPPANAYLNLLGQSLAVFSARPETFGGYHFLLLDSDEINAFAAPGGLILVTRGMVRCCENEDELAAVLAHEICHVEKKHGLKAIKQGRLTEAFTVIAAESTAQAGNKELAALTREFEGSVGDVVKTLTTSGYSRDQEREADAAAVRLLQRAGYPDGAMITMLRRMDKRLAAARGLGFAKTHPSARSRIDSLRKAIKDTAAAPDPVRQQRFSAAMPPLLAGR
jgi:predicted Zn-dependent protease